MNNKENVYEEIANSIREIDDRHASITVDELHGKNISSDLEMDSLDIVGFLLAIEEKFNVRLNDDDIEEHDLLKVDNLVNHLHDTLTSS